MASTTNLNLYKPTRDDYISVSRDISDNMQKIDDAYGAMDTAIDNLDESRVQNKDIAIVVNGSTSTKNISTGDFVVVKDSTISGITDGLYVALSNVVAGINITSSNLSSANTENGGLNALKNDLNSLDGDVDDLIGLTSVYSAPQGSSLKQIAFTDSICPSNSVKWINIRECSTSDLPFASAVYGMARVDRRVATVARVDIYTDGGAHYFCSSSDTGSTWSEWESFALNSNLNKIGTILTGTNLSSNVSVPNDTSTVVSTINLDNGKWIIIGSVDWQANATGYRQVSFGEGSNPSRQYTSTTVGLESKETYNQAIFIASVNSSTTYNLYARQNSGSSLTAYPALYAIRISG